MKTPSYLPLISLKSGWKYFQLKSAITTPMSSGLEQMGTSSIYICAFWKDELTSKQSQPIFVALGK